MLIVLIGIGFVVLLIYVFSAKTTMYVEDTPENRKRFAGKITKYIDDEEPGIDDFNDDENEITKELIASFKTNKPKIYFSYIDAKKERTNRSVEISRIDALKENGTIKHYYITGKCSLKNTRRMFRSDRMIDICYEDTGECFDDIESLLPSLKSFN